MKSQTLCLFFFLVFSLAGFSQSMDTIKLPAPQTVGGKPLMEVLKMRKSTRSYTPQELSMQELSNMLWAGCGISRPESGKRTAPSAMDWQEVDIYVSLKTGTYQYEPHANELIPVLAGDIRSQTGVQGFVAMAPVNLIFVADYSKMKGRSEELLATYAGTDTGFISENIYLYCASAGLGTVVRGMLDRDALKKTLGLPDYKHVVYAQSVGYPAQ